MKNQEFRTKEGGLKGGWWLVEGMWGGRGSGTLSTWWCVRCRDAGPRWTASWTCPCCASVAATTCCSCVRRDHRTPEYNTSYGAIRVLGVNRLYSPSSISQVRTRLNILTAIFVHSSVTLRFIMRK